MYADLSLTLYKLHFLFEFSILHILVLQNMHVDILSILCCYLSIMSMAIVRYLFTWALQSYSGQLDTIQCIHVLIPLCLTYKTKAVLCSGFPRTVIRYLF